MKRFHMLVCFLIMMMGVMGCGYQKDYYHIGVYEGIGEGHHGRIKVLVSTNTHKITDIQILEQQEVPVLSDIVYDKIPKRVMKKNSTDIDVVAGATLTSKGLLEAIEEALEKARIYNK